MHPTLFTIGKVGIPTYTVLLDLGLILGLVLTYFEGKRWLSKPDLALDLGLWTVIGGILGGRAGYVLSYLSTFREDWTQAFQIWKGGLTFLGAFLGGLVVLCIFGLAQRRSKERVSLWQMADVLVPGLALGIVFGWAACLMGGCAYGATGEGFGTMVLPDIYGIEQVRFATQIAGLVQAGLLFALFWFLRGRWPFAGAAFLMYCLLYFGGQFFVEFVRGDEALYFGRFRMGQIIEMALVAASAAGLLILWWRARREGEQIDEGVVEEGEELAAAEEIEESGIGDAAEVSLWDGSEDEVEPAAGPYEAEEGAATEEVKPADEAGDSEPQRE
ncbi:MAG TPA: prolipoprotein diacylglyceryl transferase [Anaerolineae bacterium]|nr:prolipoprotein diacylglyceryl transferase [Anaerolineae bacterium]